MQCPSCGTRNNYYHHYCYFCGNALPSLQQSEPSSEGAKHFALPDEASENYEQIPLKRYTKTTSQKRSVNYFKLFIFLTISAVLVYGAYSLFTYVEFLLTTDNEATGQITASLSVESTEFDGKPAQRIIVHTNIGEMVETLGKRFAVRDGRAEILLENAYLHSRFPQARQDDGIPITLEIIVYKEGIPVYKETLDFVMVMPPAPITLIQPRTGQAVVEEEAYRIIFSVVPGANVFINGDDFTDLLDNGGRLQKDIELQDSPETTFEIRVSKRGFEDSVTNIVLTRREMIVPLTLDQDIPIQAPAEKVIISGKTSPDATITTDLETVEEIEFNRETGEFSLSARATRMGLTPGTITAALNDGQISKIDIVIFRTTTADIYTRRAWRSNFDELLAHPTLHKGQIFLFTGRVAEVLTQGKKNEFTVNVSEDLAAQKLIFVQYWGDFEFESGERIRVFGNRWGNHEGMVRVLAPFIYN